MKSVGFNLIVGKGESDILERCLSQISKIGFDEVVICVTCDDPDVYSVAHKYASKVVSFDWTDNFSDARNYVQSKTTSDYLCFCDTDDYIPDRLISGYREAVSIVRKLDKECYTVKYHVRFDDKDTPTETILRVMFYKRTIEWLYPIHEALNVKSNMPRGNFENLYIEHRPKDNQAEHSDRNLKILKNEYENNYSPRIAFYYGKELICNGMISDGVSMFEDLVYKKEGGIENLAHAAMYLGYHYTYDNGDTTKVSKFIDIGETYIRIAISFAPGYAEMYNLLGDIYSSREDFDNAENCYKKALEQKIGGHLSQNTAHYSLIPSEKLTKIYYKKKNYEMALYYNKISIMSNMDKKRILENRGYILTELNKEYDRLKSK